MRGAAEAFRLWASILILSAFFCSLAGIALELRGRGRPDDRGDRTHEPDPPPAPEFEPEVRQAMQRERSDA